MIRWTSWHRWTAICQLAYLYLAVAVASQRQQEASSDLDSGVISVTVPELLRLLCDARAKLIGGQAANHAAGPIPPRSSLPLA